jgi:hypothetical protein
MKLDVFCVRIGNKYGLEYETYLEGKLNKYCNIHWIRESFDLNVQLQWNKMAVMALDISHPVCVMDIDILLINDFMDVFNYPIERGQFVAMPDWWDPKHRETGWKVNGGFFKYIPTECKYIYNEFVSDVDRWQRHFIDQGITSGPVNGEQYFVETFAKQRLDIINFPDAWVTRWCSDAMHSTNLMDPNDWEIKAAKWQLFTTQLYHKATGNDYVYLGDEFHPDIKMVHFTNFLNKPHEWSSYSLHV